MRIICRTRLALIKLKTSFSHRSLSTAVNGSNDDPTYFITTPIFYVNGVPHLGHFHTLVLADALHRFNKLIAHHKNTIYCTGTDEHGIKVQRTAISLNKPTIELCDEMSAAFRALCEQASISNTHFIRTTDEHHKESVREFWRRLNDGGFIYKRKYEGWYSVNDESFVSEKDTQVVEDATGAKVRICVPTRNIVEWSEEENYMFKYTQVVDGVLKWLRSGSVKPDRFVREAVNISPSDDISISRPKDRVFWGIEVPDDPSQTVYVWLDALINYLTVAGYPGRLTRWPPDCHIIGKDILKFHALLWPGFLLAAGFDLPKLILCHSHWQVDYVKMSKSIGNVVDPFKTSQRMTWDGLRYYLLRIAVLSHDANFGEEHAVNTVNADLPNDFGNLLSRATAPALNKKQIFPDGILNQSFLEEEAVKGLVVQLRSLSGRCYDHFAQGEFNGGINYICNCLRLANRIFHVKEPWVLAKSDKAEALNDVIYLSLETVRICAILLQAVVPGVASKALDKLNIAQEKRFWADAIWQPHRSSVVEPHLLNPEKIQAFPRLK